jgi:hypothetical protein
MNTTEQRISALEAVIASLKSGKTVVAPPPQPVKAIADRPLVSVLQPPPIELPTAEQGARLIEVIGREYSMLKPRYSMRWHDDEERELHAGFFTSVRFISTLGCIPADTSKHYVSVWIDRCRDWARLVDHGSVGNVGVSFFLAAVAMGVPYQLGNSATGVLPAVGLREHGGERMTADGWKQTLRGNVMAPSQAARRFEPPSPARVYGY